MLLLIGISASAEDTNLVIAIRSTSAWKEARHGEVCAMDVHSQRHVGYPLVHQ
jgi:hypothetical protein